MYCCNSCITILENFVDFFLTLLDSDALRDYDDHDDDFSLVPVQLAGVPVVPVLVQHSGRTLWRTLWPGTFHHQMGCHCQGKRIAALSIL